MVNQKLVSYIKAETARGYQVTNIRSYLVKQGYSASDVDEAIDICTGKALPTKATHNVKPLVIGGVVLVVMIAVAIWLLVPGEKSAEGEFEYSLIKAGNMQLYPGDYLSFNFEADNLGEVNKVVVKHSIRDENDREIEYKRELMDLEDNMPVEEDIKLPAKLKAGTYKLLSTANHRGKEFEQEFFFEVKGEDTSLVVEEEEEPPQIFIPESELETPMFEEEESAIEIIPAASAFDFPAEPEPEFDIEEYLTDVKGAAAVPTGVGRAVTMCDELELDRDQDSCYIEVVDVTKDKDICDSVNSDYRRDVCYISFVVEGDYSVCDKILDNDLRISCDSLKASTMPTDTTSIPVEDIAADSQAEIIVGEELLEEISEPEVVLTECEEAGGMCESDAVAYAECSIPMNTYVLSDLECGSGEHCCEPI